MIKIYIDHSIETYRWDSGLANYLDLMKQNNIVITNNIQEADVLCFILDSRTMFDQLSETKQNMLRNFPRSIIILERVDSAVCWFRDFDKLPNVVAVFKNRIMRDPQQQNETMYYGRYHYKLVYEACLDEIKKHQKGRRSFGPAENITENQRDISKNWGYSALKPISPENQAKVHAVPWDFHSSPLSKRMEPFKNIKQNMIYDVFCVNRDKPGIQGFYRAKARKIIEKLPYNTLTNPIPKEHYPKKLASSKIVVCSPGHGEWTHQDGYCMFAGCIIVKPRCDYIKMVPDIYTSDRVVFCQPDYSDLQEKITYILEHYDEYKSMIESNRKFITEWSKEKATIYFCEKVKEVLQLPCSS